MRQRLNVARALLADPDLLILDEPSNGLHSAGIVEFRQRSALSQTRRGALSSSPHASWGEVEKVCDGAAIIDRGIVLERRTRHRITSSGDQVELHCPRAQHRGRYVSGHPSRTS
jgi:ABC-type multidrug transport system ATPase subunit